MKIEYDSSRDLLYVWMGKAKAKSARTETVGPGVFADFDRTGRLIGIEILDASEILGEKVQFEVDLFPLPAERTAVG